MVNAMMARLGRKSGCTGCAYWAATGSGEQAGQCRIGPPRTSATARWPVTAPDDWCGEWQPAEPAVEVKVHTPLGGPPQDEEID